MTTKRKPSNGYWQGQVDSQLESMARDIGEIKTTLSAMNERVDTLRLWKAKVAGLATASGVLTAIVVKLVEKW